MRVHREESEDRQEQAQREHHGKLRAPVPASGVRPAPLRAQRPCADQSPSEPKNEMRWADQRFDVRLDAEETMPDHVGDTAEYEDEDPDARELVASGQCKRPGVALPPVPDERGRDHCRNGEESRVQNGMPDREERLELREVMMRPSIEKNTALKPRAQNDDGPIEAGVTEGPL